MVNYKCERCNKVFNRKCNYDYHISRKYKCKIDATNKNAENNLPKAENNLQNTENNLEIIKCEYCNKTFSTIYTCSRHKNTCKSKNNKLNDLYVELLKQLKLQQEQIQNQNNKINVLEKENKKIKDKLLKPNKINNTTNNITNNNTTNNNNKIINNYINILPFAYTTKLYSLPAKLDMGEEKIDHINKSHLYKMLNDWKLSIQNLIKDVHFNENVPENSNVYIPNIKNNYIMVYDGINWNLHLSDDIIYKLVDDKSDILLTKFSELEKNDKQNKHFELYSDKCINDDFLINVKKEIKLLLYNNKHIPINIIKNNEEITKK